MAKAVLLGIAALSLFSSAFAFAPIPSQDFCVADLEGTVRINGLPCKDPSTVTADDFTFSGLHLPPNTSNPMGSGLTSVTVNQLPGLNTLDLTLARVDYEPTGFIPPHIHHRATEMITVLSGTLEVGFVTSFPGLKHYSKQLNKGDVFVIPQGLLHYQRSAGKERVVSIAAVNSQNAGIIPVTNGIFGAIPDINPDFLARAFQLDKTTIAELQKKF